MLFGREIKRKVFLSAARAARDNTLMSHFVLSTHAGMSLRNIPHIPIIDARYFSLKGTPYRTSLYKMGPKLNIASIRKFALVKSSSDEDELPSSLFWWANS